MSWLDDLEARLDSQLQDFLSSNPAQGALLEEQERRDRLEMLRRQRLQLQQEAERSRAALLQLASEIRGWQQRVQRARDAGADDLAQRAEVHVAGLMEQGRQNWQALTELGQRFGSVEWELSQLGRQGTGGDTARASRAETSGGSAASDLRDAWATFEAEQELEELKRRVQR